MEYRLDLNDDERSKMDTASQLYQEGNISEALVILEGLSSTHPTSPMLTATIANAYWDIGDIQKAIKLFYAAVEQGPKSEKISRGLFHLLWEQKNEIDAVMELQRFINTGTPSAEYIEMAQEINDKKGFSINFPQSK